MLISATDQLGAGSNASVATGASAQLIAANPERNGLRVNVSPADTGVTYLLLGTGTASATSFHVALAAGGVWDGRISGAVWRGAVQVFASVAGRTSVQET